MNLLEFANREIVFEQTKNIRELLFARSMASSVIYDDEIQTDINLNVDDNSSMRIGLIMNELKLSKRKYFNYGLVKVAWLRICWNI